MSVQVQAYSRTIGGKVVQVGAHERSDPPGGRAPRRSTDLKEPPEIKKAYFAETNYQGAWDDIVAQFQSMGLGGNAVFAFTETMGLEGGLPVHEKAAPASGIGWDALQETKAAAPKDEALQQVTLPSDMRLAQRAFAYKVYADKALNQVGGIAALERTGNPHDAAAIFDALFHGGKAGGADAITRAANRVDDTDYVNPNGLLTPKTWEKIERIGRDDRNSRMFRAELSRLRPKAERWRREYVRYE